LTTDNDLRITLAPLRIRTGPHADELNGLLNDKLRLAGLAPVADGMQTHPYCDLCRTFVKTGQQTFTRADIELLCKTEGLWRGASITEPNAKRLGIRSFLRATDYLEDTTDDLLCLLHYFDGRAIHDPTNWIKIYADVELFLNRTTKLSCPYHIHLAAHGTVAFCAGYLLDPKTGIKVSPVQSNTQGRVVWHGIATSNSVSNWRTNEYLLSEQGTELAIAVSVTHDISNDVLQYLRNSQPSISRLLHFILPRCGISAIQDGTHAFTLAQNLVSTIRSTQTHAERKGRIHLFWAAPNAFVFFLGQMARCLGSCVLYEYDFESSTPDGYLHSLQLPILPLREPLSVKEDN
jgi:hypothetical protein